MDVFIKLVAMALIALVLHLVVSKQSKDIGLLLILVACCMILIPAITYLEYIINFFRQLQVLGKLDPKFMAILIKSVGIGLLSEISSLICTDAGNSSLGKAIQILAVVIIIYLSLPLLSGLIELVGDILGEV